MLASLSLVLLLCAPIAEPAPSNETDQTTALVGANVLPMDTERVLPDHTVLVKGDTIVALGPREEVPIPDGARIIDVEGQWLLPGLNDMHVHVMSEADLLLFVANGITAIRNMWGQSMHLDWQEEIEAGERLAPTLHTTGPIIDGSPPAWTGSDVAVTEADAEDVVAQQAEAGYSMVKVYSLLQKEPYHAILRAAKEHGMRICGHVPTAVGLEAALAAGQETIEHLTGYEGVYNDASLEHAVDVTVASGVWNCVTLVVQIRIASMDQSEELLARPEMRFVSPIIRASWDPSRDFRFRNMGSRQFDAMRTRNRMRMRLTKELYDAGGGILLGTDTPNPHVIPGFSIHEELRYFVESGLSPYEALRTGTVTPGEFFREDVGVVRVGARADLLVLKKNPLDDISHTRERRGVMLRGVFWEQEALDQKLETLAESYRLPQDPFESFDPLPDEGQDLHEATYDILYNDLLIGHERFRFEQSSDGYRVLNSQQITLGPNRGTQELRAEIDEGEIRFRIRLHADEDISEFEGFVGDGQFLLAGTTEGNDVNRELAYEGSPHIDLPCLAWKIERLEKLLRWPSDSEAQKTLELTWSPSLAMEARDVVLRRRGPLLEELSTSPRGTEQCDWRIENGRLVEYVERQSIGSVLYRIQHAQGD